MVRTGSVRLPAQMGARHAGDVGQSQPAMHKATGGYEGHRRELHRTTIAA